MPTKRPPPPAFYCRWRTAEVKNEMTGNDIAEGVSYVFFSIKPEARTALLVKLAEIDASLREKGA